MSDDLQARFDALVRGSFAFLEDAFDLTCHGTEVHLPELWTTFRGRGIAVIMTLEIGSQPWVELAFTDPRPDHPGTIVHTSLDALLALEAPGERLTPGVVMGIDDIRLPAAIDEAAAKLRQYGARLLTRDPDVTGQLADLADQAKAEIGG